MFGRFEERQNNEGGTDVIEFDKDGNEINFRENSELNFYECLHDVKDDLCFSLANFPGNNIGNIFEKVRDSLRFCLNTIQEQKYIEMLEFVVQDLDAFMNNGNGERIREFMNTSNITLISKIESLSHYSGSLDVTINPDKSVTSREVRFTSFEMGLISVYYSTNNESYDV